MAVTDARGEYRFPRVSPGAYKVTARLQGFQTYENSRVGVALGDKATVNVTLKISSVTETVVVTGERVQIAVGENQTSVAIGAEQIALLPKGRDFTSVVTQAPGVSNEANLGGISVDGASGSENRFVIDGVDTTNPQDGVGPATSSPTSWKRSRSSRPVTPPSTAGRWAASSTPSRRAARTNSTAGPVPTTRTAP